MSSLLTVRPSQLHVHLLSSCTGSLPVLFRSLLLDILSTGFPCLLENSGKSLIYFSKISRTWKVLENEIGPGKSWNLIVVQINQRA